MSKHSLGLEAGQRYVRAPGKHHLLSAMVDQDQRNFDFVASVNCSISIPAAQYSCRAIRRHLNAMLLIFSLLFQTHALAQYTDPFFQTDLDFGLYSQWIQPWRGYLETVPSTWFLKGVGVALNGSPNPDLICEMLARHGIAITRIEIGWGNVTLSNEIVDPRPISALQACHKWGLRPVILLNANQGVPCPLSGFESQVADAAPAGATRLTFTDTAGFVPGKTGISNLTSYTAAEILITAVDGNTVTLSMPLPIAIAAGQTLNMATLKYRPFSVPGSADYNQTVAGWKAYVLTVGQLAAKYLGAGNFDLEVWNELTFGSNFLYINAYYNPAFANYAEETIWPALVQATADVATANPSIFSGTELSDGFGNTIPWTASSTEPARVTGISKHCYAVQKAFPVEEYKGSGALNALLQQEDPPAFIPNYRVNFPEYAATALQTEFFIRDISPISTFIYGVMHGRNTRPGNPCYGWITECGYDPSESSITDPTTAMALKAKSTARYFCFFLHRGCKKVIVFATGGGDARLGIVKDNFLSYCGMSANYPANDDYYTSPSLAVTQRIVNQMRLYSTPSEAMRQLDVVNVTDTHNHSQFQGDGTLAHPDLYDRDVLAILPFQSNPHRFVIPYYVMTRNLFPAMAPERFNITLRGLHAATIHVQCYDPIADVYYPSSITSDANDTLTISVKATDYPYLLIVTD